MSNIFWYTIFIGGITIISIIIRRKKMTDQEKIRLNIRLETMKTLKRNSKEYWEQRCIQLEISIDPTYPPATRSNARELYMILVKK